MRRIVLMVALAACDYDTASQFERFPPPRPVVRTPDGVPRASRPSLPLAERPCAKQWSDDKGLHTYRFPEEYRETCEIPLDLFDVSLGRCPEDMFPVKGYTRGPKGLIEKGAARFADTDDVIELADTPHERWELDEKGRVMRHRVIDKLGAIIGAENYLWDGERVTYRKHYRPMTADWVVETIVYDCTKL